MEAKGNSFSKFSVFIFPFNVGHPCLYMKGMSYACFFLTAVPSHICCVLCGQCKPYHFKYCDSPITCTHLCLLVEFPIPSWGLFWLDYLAYICIQAAILRPKQQIAGCCHFYVALACSGSKDREIILTVWIMPVL